MVMVGARGSPPNPRIWARSPRELNTGESFCCTFCGGFVLQLWEEWGGHGLGGKTLVANSCVCRMSRTGSLGFRIGCSNLSFLSGNAPPKRDHPPKRQRIFRFPPKQSGASLDGDMLQIVSISGNRVAELEETSLRPIVESDKPATCQMVSLPVTP